jgi:hypothetical protein
MSVGEAEEPGDLLGGGEEAEAVGFRLFGKFHREIAGP